MRMTEYLSQGNMHYKVMERNGRYCARYQAEGNPSWFRSNHCSSKDTAEEAQDELDMVAMNHEWIEIRKGE